MSNQQSGYAYIGPDLAKDLEELAWFRAERDAANRLAEARKKRADDARKARAEGRAATPEVEVKIETVKRALDRFLPIYVSEEYVKHFVQPYCQCEPSMDGYWEFCEHACDLGLSA